MKTVIKASLTAMLVTAVSSTSLGVVGSALLVEPAFAKSEKANSKSSEARGKGQKEKSNRGKGRDKSLGKGKPNGLETLFGSLIGEERRKPKASKQASAKLVSKKHSKNSEFHPSELGNMNGALNANVNAVLAHLRNGNTNGPVGQVAALMAATVNAEGDQQIVGLENAYVVLDGAISEFGSVQGYFDSLDAAADAERVASIEDYLSVYGDDASGEEAANALKLALDGTVYEDSPDPLGDYQTVINDARDAARDNEIENAVVATGYQTSDGSFTTDRPSKTDPEALAEAESDLQAEADAEASILSYWNKNPGGEPSEETGYTAEEEQLLKDLRDRFTEDELQSIRDTATVDPTASEEDSCAPEDTECEPDDLASL